MKKVGLLFALLGWSLTLAQGSFVGVVQDSKAFVAVVVAADQKAIAYVCDSETVAQWFTGRVGTDGVLQLTNTSGTGGTIQARLNQGEVVGSFILPGQTAKAFMAKVAAGTAGLYRYDGTIEGSRYLGGWIMDQQGVQRGSVIGGGSLRASVLIPQTLMSDHPRLTNLKAWRVTPEWVSENLR